LSGSEGGGKYGVKSFGAYVPTPCWVRARSKEVIPLPLYKLKSGEYKYTVNGGFEGVFSLSSDNYLADDN
jgi:hypothetical protein